MGNEIQIFFDDDGVETIQMPHAYYKKVVAAYDKEAQKKIDRLEKIIDALLDLS